MPLTLHKSAAAIIVILGVCAVATVAPAQEAAVENEGLIVEVFVGPDVAVEAMAIERSAEGTLFLPLGEVSEAVRFPILVESQAGTASGWFLHPDRKIDLDLSSSTVTVDGVRSPLPPSAVRRTPDDLLVDANLLSQWLPLRFELDYSRMTLHLHSTEPLPLEQYNARKRLRENIRVDSALEGAVFDIEPQPYRLLGVPSHDVELQGTYPTFTQTGSHQRAVTQRNAYDVRGAGDVLFMTGQWRLRGGELNPVESADIQFGRRDPGAGLLGPLRATEVVVGDVASPSRPVIMRGVRGAGFSVSNFPLARPSSFGSQQLAGTLESGWEVEVYHNDRFVGYRRAGEREDFVLDAPVAVGLNDYRLDYYGPYGEHRVQRSSAYVGADMVRPGEFHYRLHSALQERRTIPIEDWQQSLSTYDEPRALGQFELGVARSLALSADIATLPLGDGRRNYLSGGVATYFDRVYGTARLVGDLQGGAAGEIAAQTRVLGAELAARHVHFVGLFASEEFPLRSEPLASRTNSRVSGALPLWGEHVLPAALTLRWDRHLNAVDRLSLLGDVGGALFHAFGWSHSLQVHARPTEFENIGGRGSIRWRNTMFAPKLEAGYIAYPKPVLSHYSGSTGIRLSRTLGVDLRVLRTVAPLQSVVASAGVRHRWEFFEWAFDAGYSTEAGVSAGVTLRTSLGPDPADGGLMLSAAPRTTHGAVVAHVYRDNDFDGKPSDGDESLEGTTLAVDGQPRSALVTNNDGRAVLMDAPLDRYLNMGLVRSTLADPYDSPVSDGATVVVRPGSVAYLDLPVLLTGQVEGIVWRREAEALQPTGGMELQLLNAEGVVVASTSSAFDGFYLFEFVPPGAYTVRVNSKQLTRMSCRAKPVFVTLAPGGSIAMQQDVEVYSIVPPLKERRLNEPAHLRVSASAPVSADGS